jgi:hypothetical protein
MGRAANVDQRSRGQPSKPRSSSHRPQASREQDFGEQTGLGITFQARSQSGNWPQSFQSQQSPIPGPSASHTGQSTWVQYQPLQYYPASAPQTQQTHASSYQNVLEKERLLSLFKDNADEELTDPSLLVNQTPIDYHDLLGAVDDGRRVIQPHLWTTYAQECEDCLMTERDSRLSASNRYHRTVHYAWSLRDGPNSRDLFSPLFPVLPSLPIGRVPSTQIWDSYRFVDNGHGPGPHERMICGQDKQYWGTDRRSTP